MDAVERSFDRLYGIPCWGVEWDRQLGLSMSFGEPHLRIREPSAKPGRSKRVKQRFSYRNVTVRGASWLWIRSARWKLTLRDEPSVTSSASDRRIRNSIRWLDGQKLIRARIDLATGHTSMDFDLGSALVIQRGRRDPEQDLWTLYKPNGKALAVRGDGCYTNEMATAREIYRVRRSPGR